MPQRDRSRAEGTAAGLIVSRRTVLAGVGVALCSPSTSNAVTATRVGVPGALGLAPERLAAACGRPVIMIPYGSWGALRDHAASGGAGLIDAAVMPDGAGPGLPVRAPSLWRRSGTWPGRVGVPIAHRSSDAVLRRLLGADVQIVALSTNALWPNLAAGLLDAAVLLGEPPPTFFLTLQRVQIAAADAAMLLPPLQVVHLGAGA